MNGVPALSLCVTPENTPSPKTVVSVAQAVPQYKRNNSAGCSSNYDTWHRKMRALIRRNRRESPSRITIRVEINRSVPRVTVRFYYVQSF